MKIGSLSSTLFSRSATSRIVMTAAAVGGIVFTGACEDSFSSCENTRTCEGDGGTDSGAGGLGGSGGSTLTGGASVSSGSAAGSGGATDTGGASDVDASADGSTGGGPGEGGEVDGGDLDGGSGGATGDGGGAGGSLATGGASTGGAPASTPLVIPNFVLPPPTLGKAYSFQIPHTGGSPTVTFRTSGGSLPAGLVLGSNGVLSGTPTAWGDFVFTIEATSGADVVKHNQSIRVVSRMWLVYDSDDRKATTFDRFAINVGAGTPYKPTLIGPGTDNQAWSADGKTLAYFDSVNGVSSLYLGDFSDVNVTASAKVWSSGTACDPLWKWSPDSQNILIACQATVWVIPRATPSTPRVLSLSDTVRRISWSPDAKWFTTAIWPSDENQYYMLVRTDSSIPPLKISSPDIDLAEPFWTPKSDAIAVTGRMTADQYRTYYFGKVPTSGSDTTSLRQPTPVFSTLLDHAVGTPPVFDTNSTLMFASIMPGSSPTFARIDLSNLPSSNSPALNLIGTAAQFDPWNMNAEMVSNDRWLFLTCGFNSTNSYYTLCSWFVPTVGLPVTHASSNASYAISPDKTQVAIGERRTSDNFGALMRYRFANQSLDLIDTLNTPTATTEQTNIAFSPDGGSLFFVENGHQYFYSNLRTTVSSTTSVATVPTADIPFLSKQAWSPASTHLAFVTANNSLTASVVQLVDVRSGKPGAPVQLNGTGRTRLFSWQPTFP